MNSCDALIAISDSILNSINSLDKLEYNKNGRKYKFINNGFQRIKQEDKHLVINLNNSSMKCSYISAYNILSSINDGALLKQHPDFCLAIMGVARELELNQWYENSSIINYSSATAFPAELTDSALDFSSNVTPRHIEMGLNLLIASKINFFHTDHHIGTKIYGLYLIKYMQDYFGEESINDADILVALKSFVHWGSIKCILYKLQLPNVFLTDDEFLSYKNFHDPALELKQEIWKKYPSGTSKYAFIKKAMQSLLGFEFSQLIEYPSDPKYDLEWLYDLCKDIETDPVKYHLRASSKSLSEKPVNLAEVSSKYSDKIKSLMNLISILIHLFDLNFEYLLKNSRLPKFEEINEPELIEKYTDLSNKIKFYKLKEWTNDDILLRLNTPNIISLSHKVEELNESRPSLTDIFCAIRFVQKKASQLMELLPEGQSNSVQVLWEDQQNINQFSTLINEKDELTAQLENLKTEKDYLDDLSLELELLDEEEKIQYKLGDAFVFLKVSKAVERIDKENEVITEKIDSTESRIDDLETQLKELKAQLYAKFGKNINLER